MSGVLIRAYVPKDRPAVLAGIVGLQEHERRLHDTRLPGEAGLAGRYLDRLKRQIARGAGLILVAEQDGRVTGYVACRVVREDSILETAESRVYGYVQDLFVVPAKRGTGLGQALLAAAEHHLTTTGVRRVRVSALAANALARRAYQRRGFEPYEITYEKRI